MQGCGSGQDGQTYGSATVAALSSADVVRIVVTVSKTGTTDIVQELTPPAIPTDPWNGTITDIPVGDDYTFAAEAFDSLDPAALPVYTGSASPVTVTEDSNPLVVISLLPTTVPGDFSNRAPIIDQLIVSDTNVTTDQIVFLSVSVTDTAGDVLTLEWTSTGGAFVGSADGPTETWASDTIGTFSITFSVTDDRGARSSVTVVINVSPAAASVPVQFTFGNVPPEILGLTSTESTLVPGGSTDLEVTVSDDDSDVLSRTHAWSASPCTGTFSTPTAAITSFTLTSASGAECELSVLVGDGDGGTNTATLTIGTDLPVVGNACLNVSCTQQSDCDTGFSGAPYSCYPGGGGEVCCATGEVAEGGTCSTVNDCVEGAACLETAGPGSGTCLRLCSTGGECDSLVCTPLSAPNIFGVCLP